MALQPSRIIDMRVRPPAAGFETLALYSDKSRILRMTRDMGFEPPPSYLADSLETCLAEMQAAGISIGVITGRQGGQRMGHVSNDAIASLVAQYPDRFWGMGGIDTGNIPGARSEIQKIAGNERLCGVVVESGCCEPPRYCDDPALDSVFGDCEDAGLPVLLMAGGNAGPDVSYSDPAAIDRLATRHPRLQIVSAHGSWPWVSQILGIAFRRTNVWVSPDMYLFMPGWQMYVDAANGFLKDRFLFGTAYPALPFKASVDAFMKLPFDAKVLPKILHENATRLLARQQSRP